MPKVYITQVPHKKDKATGSLVPSVNISPASEHGEIVIMMPPRATFFATADLIKQLREQLKDYDYEGGDALIAMGDPVVIAAACAVLAIKGSFTVLRWDKNLGRYNQARLAV